MNCCLGSVNKSDCFSLLCVVIHLLTRKYFWLSGVQIHPHFFHKRVQAIPKKECPRIIHAFMLTLLPPLCFTSEMKHSLPTSGNNSTFIFHSLSFSMLWSATWSPSPRIIEHRIWIPFIDILGMVTPVGEITAMVEVWASLFSSPCLSGENYCSLLSPDTEAVHKSWQQEYLAFCVNYEEGLRPCWGHQTPLSFFWMLVVLGQCSRPPVKGQR